MREIEVRRAFASKDLTVLEVEGPSKPLRWVVVPGDLRIVLELTPEAQEVGEDRGRIFFTAAELTWDRAEAQLTLLGKNYNLRSTTASTLTQDMIDRVHSSSQPPLRGDATFMFRNLQPSDVRFFHRWIRDPEVIRFSMTKFHRLARPEEIEAWFHGTLFDRAVHQFGIVDPGTDELIGYAGISALNEIDGNGEYFIFIGNKMYWGRGIASKVTRLFVQDAFEVLKLHRLFLTASGLNPGALRAYEKAGFKYEGRLREAFFRNGEFSDKLIMGILGSEYFANKEVSRDE